MKRQAVIGIAATALAVGLTSVALAGPPVATGKPAYDPHLKFVGQDNVGAESGGNAEIDVVGDLAFMGTFVSEELDVGLNIADISDPANPVRIGVLRQIARVADAKAADIDGDGVADIAVITNELPGTLNSDGSIKNLPLQQMRRGFVVVDVSMPSMPQEIFFQETLSVTDDGAAGPRGTHNTFISLIQGTDEACSYHGSGEETRVLVHLATETNNYPIYDVTDTVDSGGAIPPVLCSNVALGAANTSSPSVLPGTGPDDIDPEDNAVGIHDVVVQEDPGDSGRLLAYLAYFDAGLRIVDVTDPTAPFQVGGENYGPPQEQKQLNHFARPTPDGELTMSCDEIGTGTPGICRVHDSSGLVGMGIPMGAVSIAGEATTPTIGTYTIPQNNAPQNGAVRGFTFTHHNFDLTDELMIMGDYAAGVRVGDLSSCRTATVDAPCEVELVAKFLTGGGNGIGTEASNDGLDAFFNPAFPSYWGAVFEPDPAGGGLIYASDFTAGLYILRLVER